MAISFFGPLGKPVIMAIGNSRVIFILDMIALGASKILDNVLTDIFQNDKTTVMSWHFKGDPMLFMQSLPLLKFYQKFAHFLDLPREYNRVTGKAMNTPQTVICETLLEQKKCELESNCNWEKRPIRLSQVHYAAMEVFVQIEIFRKLKLIAKDKKMDPFINQRYSIDFMQSHTLTNAHERTGNDKQ